MTNRKEKEEETNRPKETSTHRKTNLLLNFKKYLTEDKRTNNIYFKETNSDNKLFQISKETENIFFGIHPVFLDTKSDIFNKKPSLLQANDLGFDLSFSTTNKNLLSLNKEKNEQKKLIITPSFGVKNIKFRSESYIIYFKEYYVKWLKKSIVQEHGKLFADKLNKIYNLNFYSFTKNGNIYKNKVYLKLMIKDILCFKNNSKNKENSKAIDLIYNDPEENKSIILILEETIENSIKKYYLTKDFELFKELKKTKEFDKLFYEINYSSFLDENGFMNYFNKIK